MERFERNLYRFPRLDRTKTWDDEDGIRIWHDCKKYKLQPAKARVELVRTSESEDSIAFKCAYCSFKYKYKRIHFSE